MASLTTWVGGWVGWQQQKNTLQLTSESVTQSCIPCVNMCYKYIVCVVLFFKQDADKKYVSPVLGDYICIRIIHYCFFCLRLNSGLTLHGRHVANGDNFTVLATKYIKWRSLMATRPIIDLSFNFLSVP